MHGSNSNEAIKHCNTQSRGNTCMTLHTVSATRSIPQNDRSYHEERDVKAAQCNAQGGPTIAKNIGTRRVSLCQIRPIAAVEATIGSWKVCVPGLMVVLWLRLELARTACTQRQRQRAEKWSPQCPHNIEEPSMIVSANVMHPVLWFLTSIIMAGTESIRTA